MTPSGFFSSDAFDFSPMQDQLGVPYRVVPRCFGHSLSLLPDSGIGLGATDRGAGGDPSQATFLIPVQRKRRVGGRMHTDSEVEADFALEASHGCLPRRGALFGLSCCGSESMTEEAVEAQEGSPADDGTPEWTRSPGVVRPDSVTRLQREIKELRADSLCNPTGRRQPHHGTHDGPHIRLQKCPSLLAGVRCYCTIKWIGRRNRCTAAALSFGGICIECGAFGAGIRAGVASGVGGRTVGSLWIAGATGRLSATI